MTERKWMPHDYQDEVVPPARPSPDDWITQFDDGAPALVAGDFSDDKEPGRALRSGEVVKFDWIETYGSRQMTFRRSEDGWKWELHGDQPTASPAGDMFVAEVGNWESAMPSLNEFAEAYADFVSEDGEEITVVFYAWSSGPSEFEFRDGSFHAVAENPPGPLSEAGP